MKKKRTYICKYIHYICIKKLYLKPQMKKSHKIVMNQKVPMIWCLTNSGPNYLVYDFSYPLIPWKIKSAENKHLLMDRIVIWRFHHLFIKKVCYKSCVPWDLFVYVNFPQTQGIRLLHCNVFFHLPYISKLAKLLFNFTFCHMGIGGKSGCVSWNMPTLISVRNCESFFWILSLPNIK